MESYDVIANQPVVIDNVRGSLAVRLRWTLAVKSDELYIFSVSRHVCRALALSRLDLLGIKYPSATFQACKHIFVKEITRERERERERGGGGGGVREDDVFYARSRGVFSLAVR